jgi:hypothetical protein
LAFSLVSICVPSFNAALELTSRQVKSSQDKKKIDRRSLFSPVVVAAWRQKRNTRGRDENEAWKPCPCLQHNPRMEGKGRDLADEMAIEMGGSEYQCFF